MAASLTLVGNLAYRLDKPSLSLHTNPGFNWAAQEEVRSIRESSAGHTPGTFCKFCKELIELKGSNNFIHQAGYRALSASALDCSLCYLLLSSLDRGIPPWVLTEETTLHDNESPLEDVKDSIIILGLPASPKNENIHSQFIVTWRAKGFNGLGK
jgi:hypothetical protein